MIVQKLDKNLNDFSKYINDFNKKYKSVITDYFAGFLKVKKICQKCKNESNSFNFFPYIEFNLDSFNKNPNFESWFKEQNEKYLDLNEEYNLICEKCEKITIQREFKQFLEFPQNLVILLNEKEEFRIPEKINYPSSLDLSQIVEKKASNSNSKYNLVGLVKRISKEENEYYISIYYDPNQNLWFISDHYNLTKIDKDKALTHNDGIILLLFYSVIIDIGD